MDTNTSSSVTSNTTPEAAKVQEGATPPHVAAPSGKARVAVGFLTRATNAELIGLILVIINAMTGNAAYPKAIPKLSEIAAARNRFIAAVDAAKDSRQAIALRNQQRASLTAMVRNLAHYVQATCNGDLPTLLSSGFTPQRSKLPVGKLSAPLNLQLVRGRISGQIDARCTKMAQAGAYEWRFANAATPTDWVEIDATFAASVTLEGLVPGMQYIVQVRALGTAGPSDWSDAAMLMSV